MLINKIQLKSEINQQKQLLLNMTGSIWQSFFEKDSFDEFYNSIIFIQNQVKNSMWFDIDIHINDCFKNIG